MTNIDKTDLNLTELSQDEKISLAMKSGNKPFISNQRMDANRWQLKKNIKAENYKQHSVVGRFSFLLASNKLQVAGMFLTFSLGFIVASNGSLLKQAAQGETASIVSKSIESSTLSPRDQIVNFDIGENERGDASFNVSYTTIKKTNLSTDLGNENTVLLLTSAMKSDINDATRLKLIEVLKDHLENKNIRDSLSHSLLNDSNPGVRMVAAESLAKLSSNQMIREALRQALLNDTNQGVRISAFNGLLTHLDEKTIETFKVQGAKDSNFYIRNKAQDIIEESQQKNSLNQSI